MTTPRRTTKKATASTSANANAAKTDEVTTENDETATAAPSDTADKQPTPAEIADSPAKDNAKESEPVIRVEVVHGGAMVAGRPREKGAKIELRGRQISDTKDRNGNSWLDIIDDSDAQVEKYGKVLFKSY